MYPHDTIFRSTTSLLIGVLIHLQRYDFFGGTKEPLFLGEEISSSLSWNTHLSCYHVRELP